MSKLKVLLTFLLILSINLLIAQKGTIRGIVIDNNNAEEIIGASVILDGTTIGVSTDLDGKFDLVVEPGVYNLKVSYISYATLIIENVEVKPGEINFLGTIRLEENTELLNEVVISATFIRNTEASLLTMKKKSTNLIDGISSDLIKKSGVSNAASAMTKVTGVSIQEGKYIYVRGLGDRYTKTTLNGMDIPGLDPDRNTIQMDIFPTNVVNNITVSKSFTAEQSGDFTGGVVDIELIDFPDERTFDVSVGLGYNPSMHFNENYTTYEGGSGDLIGLGSSSREIPSDRRTSIPQFADVIGRPNGPEGQDYQRILRKFDPVVGTSNEQSAMDFSLGISFADQKKLKKSTIGYNFALTYKNDTEFYEDAEFNLYGKPQDKSTFELDPLEQQTGSFGTNNVLLGALAGVALKTDNSKHKLSLLQLQNGEKKAGNFFYENSNLGANFEANQYNLEYSERMLTNLLIEGDYSLPNDYKLNWKISPTRSSIIDPDIRFLRFRLPNQTISSEVGLPERIWRYLEEYNVSSKVDLEKDYKLKGNKSKLKFGGSYTFKERDYEIQSFQINPGNTVFTGDPNELFLEENLFSADNINGVRYEPSFIPNNPNQFNSSVHHVGAYISNEFNVAALLKAIVGLRVEKYDQFYTGTNQTATIVLDNERVIDDFDYFPTLNLIYNYRENQNLRFSATKTIARPSFKEMSFAEIADPITGRTFIGSLLRELQSDGSTIDTLWDGNLRSTDIVNLDLRWELFSEKAQMVSVSAFYKRFYNPIEIVQFLSDQGSFQARNVGDAQVFGAEFELRQNFNFIQPKLENLFMTANLTLTHSEIALSESERRSRTISAREGEEVIEKRQMAGQAPYIINLGLMYNYPKWKLESGIFYNVQGETLLFVGFANKTDVYSVPFHSLNLKLSKVLGENENMSLSIQANNILNDEKEQIFKSFNAENQIFSRLRPQRFYSLGFTYKF